MNNEDDGEHGGARARLVAALGSKGLSEAARAYDEAGHEPGLERTLELAHALAEACEDERSRARLAGELHGFGDQAEDVPSVRQVAGFASAFPVRALDLGLLDPEEIFSVNNEKFSQVTLTIGQPVGELERALEQIRAGGVLALRVPASEVTNDSAITDPDAEVYIYILPREIRAIVEEAYRAAHAAFVRPLVAAALGSD